MNMGQTHAETYDEVINMLTKQPCVRKVYLYGSCARGTFTYKSDMDLLILVAEDTSKDVIKGIANLDFGLHYSSPDVQLVVKPLSYLNEKSTFLDRIRKDWKLAYENIS